MSLYMLVGCWDMLLSIVIQSSSVSARSEAGLMLMFLGLFYVFADHLKYPFAGWDANSTILQPSH